MHNSVPVVSRAAERAEFCVEVLLPGACDSRGAGDGLGCGLARNPSRCALRWSPRESDRGSSPELRARPARARTDDIAYPKDPHARRGTPEPAIVHIIRRGTGSVRRSVDPVGNRAKRRSRGPASANPHSRSHQSQVRGPAVGDADQLRPVHGRIVRAGRRRGAAGRRFRSEQRLRPRHDPAGDRRRADSPGSCSRLGDDARTHRRRPALRQL